ncbi:5-(carboxyamino)imidazole ribonucleotide mutase [Dehalobacter sp. DCM]|uniref:5-(carboxyamino)imidazole ribonucleotide mutase n=1 Tax=Dehalobacter sp. DCM TaxID=2907827 RepID=UPI00308150A6|nr:5-(carboxyamino)imidazole ribonucleotide mutase [Dehalobacter sp. DCM]
MVSVGIVMGSDSDLTIMEDAAKIMDQFSISYEMKISSAHRTLKRTVDWVEGFVQQGGKVIIAGAGMAAHLPGVIAGACVVPVIGVPIKSGALDGIDALYAIVQMPPGIPVATVGINSARNAALLAVEMLAMADARLQEELLKYRQKMAADVEAKDNALQDKLKAAK